MKHFATLVAAAALVLNLGVEAAYAHNESVKMTFSGTSENTAINLQQPNTSNDEDTFAGKGTLGSFTLLNVRAIANSPTPSSTCSGPNLLYLEELAGAGVFRFQDGSLLNVTLTQGADCIDLAANVAHCTLTFQITSGTGRFKEASGVLTNDRDGECSGVRRAWQPCVVCRDGGVYGNDFRSRHRGRPRCAEIERSDVGRQPSRPTAPPCGAKWRNP